ncbi:hypothetical protein TWF281_009576 [Arthrobotrys megalospora]
MNRLLLLSLYFLLSLPLSSCRDAEDFDLTEKSTVKDILTPKPTATKTTSTTTRTHTATAVVTETGDITKPSNPNDPPVDGTLNRKVDWGYEASDIFVACLLPNAKQRGNAEWMASLNKRIDDKRYKKLEKEKDFDFTTQSKPLGTVTRCFQAMYGNFLEILRTHGEGIQGYVDYTNIYSIKFPKPADDDIYPNPTRPGKQGSNQKPMKHKHKRSPDIPLHLQQTPVKTLRERTKDFVKRGISKVSNLSLHKRYEQEGQDDTYLFKRQDKKDDKPVDMAPKLRRGVDFTQDTAVYSTGPPAMGIDEEYIFDENDGKDATVYIIDGGLNITHSAFSWKNVKDPQNIGWIWAGPRPSNKQKDHSPKKFDDAVTGSHVASKVIGAKTGLARLASVYMVVPYDSMGGMNIITYLDAMVKMHEQIRTTSGAKPDKKIVICFSHPVIHLARAPEFIRWPQYSNMTQNKKDFMNAATFVLDQILNDFGNMKNVVMVTRATGLPLNKASDSLLDWPARRANTGNVTNLVVVGGVDNDGMKIMQAPESVTIYAPAKNIRVPYWHATNEDAYVTIPYSIRLSVGSVSGLLAFFMSKYNEDGRAAKNRLEANAFPRIRNGYSVAWNGLRVPFCSSGDDAKGEPSNEKRTLLPRAPAYNAGIPISCRPGKYRAELTTIKATINGTTTLIPTMAYLYAADGPGYTQEIPPIPRPTIFRQTYDKTITRTTTVPASVFDANLEKYKQSLRDGKLPKPAAKIKTPKPPDGVPLTTTNKYGKVETYLVIMKTVIASTTPAGTAETTSTTMDPSKGGSFTTIVSSTGRETTFTTSTVGISSDKDIVIPGAVGNTTITNSGAT